MSKLICNQRILWTLFLLAFLVASPGCAQRTFSSPDQAVTTLIDALRTGDQHQLSEIFGPFNSDLLSSGDPVADKISMDNFITLYDEKHGIVPTDSSATLVVGNTDWPLPIPIVKDAHKGTWRFDTAAGKEEIINRRIGRNELDTIQVCLAIVDAQREFAINDPDHDGLPAYAQKFLSDPGRKNGLYWETAEGEDPSPLGDLIADAAAKGYTRPAGGGPVPFHGYCFRIISSQGPSAKGGARDYMVGTHMMGGFAIVAYPAEHGNSGVMTFITNQDGDIYQCDLGPDTAKTAEKMKSFDPDSNWDKVDPPAPETP